MLPADIHLQISPLTPRSCSSPECQIHIQHQTCELLNNSKNMSKRPEIPQILVQTKRQWAVLHGGAHPAWLLVPWQGMESDTLGAWVSPSLSHTWMSGQAESLSGGVCLSLLAGGDVQMTVSSPGAVWVTQRTHSEPALCNLQQRLWLVEGCALKTLGKAFICKLGDCFGCILFPSLF